jgi:hypothetical protein
VEEERNSPGLERAVEIKFVTFLLDRQKAGTFFTDFADIYSR